ncbi:GGDEF-domain containing protein [Malaciobacter mytili LMG 24559]|uniref:GGDEF-domain containing protein n=1 Tax=Malaciobacter mytili LMG 24559 TaxID=1032238 RepID=A0AAX2AD97_9BACT|nr:EAL domain-containing protein [Malaciobacter mytili]AXH14995.1 diguanylate cyclase/phosphodiesterase [Malaciobacter mytili LMG 24559]RXK15009.1 GGDEF-domain containing protein [Malaciobacter mytili LMG 24559]
MHFDVLIADDEIINDKKLIKSMQKTLKNVNLSFTTNEEEIISKLLSLNLLIININTQNSISLAKKCRNENIDVIFIIDNTNTLDIAYSIEVFDFIYKPIFQNKLLFKIEHYVKIREKEKEILKQKEFSSIILNNIATPIFLTDGNSFLFANKNFLKILGFESLEEINKSHPCVSGIFEKREGFLFSDKKNNWLESLETNNNLKVLIKDYKNKERIYKIQANYLKQDANYLIFLDDITHEVEYKNELIKLLYTDNLTKKPNRAKLIDELQHNEININSLAIIDINSFKEINDFFGNKVGDLVLIEITNIIEKEIKKLATLKLYKFPSDTYCITGENIGKNDFLAIIKNIVSAIYKQSIILEQHEIDTRVTVGISFSTKNNKLITADLALQAAKKDNKDYLVFYDKLDNLQEYENNMKWTKKLKNALLEDKIIVYYQPLINNVTLQVDKYECLVRMIDEDKVISPFFFLDISKKSNQYTKITRIVIDKAFKKFDTLDYEFSINISYEDIEDFTFLDFIKEKMKKYNVKNKVVFEILEDESIKNYDILIKFIDEIKNLGCKVALDDFGSGYSNFEHILKMNVDFLKIDASLIKNIVTDKNSLKITKTIIEFAKSLGLKTIAEYVENEEIFNTVKKLGADYSQGYYFSEPKETPEINNTSIKGKNE